MSPLGESGLDIAAKASDAETICTTCSNSSAHAGVGQCKGRIEGYLAWQGSGGSGGTLLSHACILALLPTGVNGTPT